MFNAKLPDVANCTLNYDNDIATDVEEIGLRSEYAEFLADKNTPHISFLEWHRAKLSDADKALIEKQEIEHANYLREKLNNWVKKSAIFDSIAIENNRAASSVL